MTSILLVAPTGSPLQQLHRSWSDSRPRDSVTFLTDLGAVADTLNGRAWSVMLLDGSLPDQAASEVLANAMDHHPNLIRLLVLPEDQGHVTNIQGAHQVLPCREDIAYLDPVIDAALAVSAQIAGNERLARLVSRLQKVPSPPMLYFDLRDALESAQGDLEQIAEITSRDPGLTAQVLKIANSGFYALPRSVSDLSDAIRLLGTDTLLSLVLAAHVFAGMPPPGMRLDVLWQHSAHVSALARQIAEMDGAKRNDQGMCTVAGLLHDIGLLVLLENDSSTYQPLWNQTGGDEGELAELERKTYGITHGELGGLVLKLWTLPAPIVEAVNFSHRWDAPVNTPVAQAVMTAEWLLDLAGDGMPSADALPEFLSGTANDRLVSWMQFRDEVEEQVA